MSLRNKLTILSATLISLMTTQAHAENDQAPVSSRIESEEYVLEVDAPEGWQATNQYAIPSLIEFGGSNFHTLQFVDGTVNHGCVVFFNSEVNEDDDDNDDEEDFDVFLTAMVSDAHKLIFGSAPTRFTMTRVEFAKDVLTDLQNEEVVANWKGYIKGIIRKEVTKTTTLEGQTEPTITQERVNSPLTINGEFILNSSKELAFGIGHFDYEGATYLGATGLIVDDDYQIFIIAWGADEETLLNDILAFSKAYQVTEKFVTPVIADDYAETASDVFNTTDFTEAPGEVPVIDIPVTETQI